MRSGHCTWREVRGLEPLGVSWGHVTRELAANSNLGLRNYISHTVEVKIFFLFPIALVHTMATPYDADNPMGDDDMNFQTHRTRETDPGGRSRKGKEKRTRSEPPSSDTDKERKWSQHSPSPGASQSTERPRRTSEERQRRHQCLHHQLVVLQRAWEPCSSRPMQRLPRLRVTHLWACPR